MDTEEIKRSLGSSKTKMLLEVIKGPWSNAYPHFGSAESASVFHNKYCNQHLILNDATFTVHPTQYPSGEEVKYLYKEINFTGSSAIVALTNTSSTSVSVAVPAAAATPTATTSAAPAPAPALAATISVRDAAARVAAHSNDEIRDLKRRRKYLKKALKRKS
ncbi:hypothetical protein PS15m_007616 [Mucor circinelloides]